jgi:dTDP-4-dehydrorhamnose reductase
MARILVFGARGMLGSALARGLAGGRHAVTVSSRAGFDIGGSDWSGLPAQVAGHDYVLNAAGLINRRAVSPALRRRVNAVFPHALARACETTGARLIHFSTDCVFAGLAGPYDERHPPDADDEYGRGKADGEPATALTLRTSIIGPECDRFHNLLCWCLRQRRMDGYVDHRWNGVTTPALAAAVAHIIEADLFAPGLRHVHADDTDKHALLRLICRAFGHDAELRPVPGPAPRDTRLRSVHASFLQALRLPPIAAQVEALARHATPLGGWRAA